MCNDSNEQFHDYACYAAIVVAFIRYPFETYEHRAFGFVNSVWMEKGEKNTHYILFRNSIHSDKIESL